jgi:outer membrane protein TolC
MHILAASLARASGRIISTLFLILLGTAAATAAELTAARLEPLRFAAAPEPVTLNGGAATPLERVIALAREHNPEIHAALREKEAAEHRVAPASALDDPMLEMGVLNLPVSSFSFSREDMTMKMLGLTQRIPYPGKRVLRREVAERNAESISHAYDETVNRVTREAKIAYYDLALVLESTRLIEQNREIVQQLMKVADTRYSVGQGSQLDVLRAQTQLSRMSEELIKLGRERPNAEAELMHAIGRPLRDELALTPGLDLREFPLSLEALDELASISRPRLLALRSIVARSSRALELAAKDRYPDFDVRLAYGQRENMPDGSRRSDMVSFTVAMNLPVWRDTKIKPRIAEAAAMHEQASSMYEGQRHEITMRLRQQLAAAEQNLRAARLYRTEILPQARLAAEATVAAYQVGRGEFALLLENQMSIFSYRIAEAAAVTNYSKAIAEIEFLTGQESLKRVEAQRSSR